MRTIRHDQSTGSILESPDLERIEFALRYYRHLVSLREYVDENINTSFQLTDAAASIGISSSRLSHLFVEKTGTSFSDWIRYRRIRNAAEILSVDDRAVADVALSVGYENVRTFERSFKRTMGITPSEYREKVATQFLS